MFELITLAAATALAFSLGFAIAWAKGGKTRELLAAAEARAEEQAYATRVSMVLSVDTGPCGQFYVLDLCGSPAPMTPRAPRGARA